ncbi:MAG: 1-aminocyclopropane-1-carboxylate deaminase/D-cysteine desulfhydrase [Chitinophagaceae bacterium]
MQELQHDRVSIQEVSLLLHNKTRLSLTILRLDQLHPIVSGNKWYKLQYHLKEAVQQNKKRIITWGGAWSNHILATAAACQLMGLQSLGIIRGEKPTNFSNTLQEAEKMGMQFCFLTRENYQQRIIPTGLLSQDDWEIPEGGYSALGAKGASTIANLFQSKDFTHIICAVGTGTMMAGILNAMPTTTQVIGIPVLKGSKALDQAVKKLLVRPNENWNLIPGYEWGGYAKHPQGLLDFMNQWYLETNIPTDIVYTGKLCFAVNDLIKKNYFPENSKLLIIHSGGLQGNRSLATNTLRF